jgi:hypothetical protein
LFYIEVIGGTKTWVMWMSEAKLGKSPEEIMNYLERAMIHGWHHNFELFGFSPWASAFVVVEAISVHTNHYQIFDTDKDLTDVLSTLSGIDYNTFKEMWSKLSEEQRAKVIDVATYNIALIGVRELLKWVAKKLSSKKYKEARAQILQAAKDYLNGKIDEFALMNKIAEVLWPTEKDKEENGRDYDDFVNAEALIEEYLDREGFKELVKKYLVEGLEKLK